MRSVIKIFGFSVALLSAAPALAGPNECKEAVDKYNQASTDISDYLRRYSSCVASSQGHDDCSSEFRRLKSAQDDFETAVSEYASGCN